MTEEILAVTEEVLAVVEKLEKVEQRLLAERAVLIEYAKAKIEASDWHGCADACCDLRDVDSQLEILEMLKES